MRMSNTSVVLWSINLMFWLIFDLFQLIPDYTVIYQVQDLVNTVSIDIKLHGYILTPARIYSVQ